MIPIYNLIVHAEIGVFHGIAIFLFPLMLQAVQVAHGEKPDRRLVWMSGVFGFFGGYAIITTGSGWEDRAFFFPVLYGICLVYVAFFLAQTAMMVGQALSYRAWRLAAAGYMKEPEDEDRARAMLDLVSKNRGRNRITGWFVLFGVLMVVQHPVFFLFPAIVVAWLSYEGHLAHEKKNMLVETTDFTPLDLGEIEWRSISSPKTGAIE